MGRVAFPGMRTVTEWLGEYGASHQHPTNKLLHWICVPPIVLAVMVILLQMAIKTFDLVRALTGGGPGIATNMPATVVYDFMFQRGQIGRGAAAAMLMLLALVIVIVPYKLHERWRARS